MYITKTSSVGGILPVHVHHFLNCVFGWARGIVIATIADVDPLSFEPEDEGGNRSRVCFYDRFVPLRNMNLAKQFWKRLAIIFWKESLHKQGCINREMVSRLPLLPGLAFVTGFRHDPVPPGCILATEVSDCAAESTLIDTRSVRRKISSTSLKLRAFFLSSSGPTLYFDGTHPTDDASKDEPTPRLTLSAELRVGILDGSDKASGLKIEYISGAAYGAWWSENEVGVSLIQLIYPCCLITFVLAICVRAGEAF